MQGAPNASAEALYDGVTVTHQPTEAKIVEGTTSTCVIRSTATFSGDEAKASQFAKMAIHVSAAAGLDLRIMSGQAADSRVSHRLPSAAR
jgi:hypothetical protein